jgi:hypothetical protein
MDHGPVAERLEANDFQPLDSHGAFASVSLQPGIMYGNVTSRQINILNQACKAAFPGLPKRTTFLPYNSRVRAALLLLVLVWAGAARAEPPLLRVRARMRIDLQSVVRVPGGVVLRGALVDPALGETIPGRTVAVAIDGPNGFYRYAEPTSPDGTFRWRVPLALGQYSLRLAAGGDEDYAGAVPVERSLDVGRRSPTLTLDAPSTLSVVEPELRLVVEARDPEGDLDAPLGVSSARHDEGVRVELPVVVTVDGRPLQRGRTVKGRFEAPLATHELGQAGSTVTVTARFDGDELRNPAQATRAVRLTTPTLLTLIASSLALGPSDDLELSGTVRDASGPIGGATVEIEADGERVVERALSGADGSFRATVRGRTLGQGRVAVRAAYHPSQSWRDEGRSSPVAISILARAARPRWSPLWLASPLVTLLGIFGTLLVRRKPWRKWVPAIRARVQPRPRASESGLAERRPRLLRTLRAADDFGLGGQVRDAETRAPIAGATVAVAVDGTRMSAVSDGEGRFALEGLPAGTARVEVAARGFGTERFERAIPHRGELRGAEVRLVAIKSAIFSTWKGTARPLCPTPALIEVWTPREVLQHTRARRLLTNELEALTALVEESCFSARIPEAEDLTETERLCRVIAPR